MSKHVGPVSLWEILEGTNEPLKKAIAYIRQNCCSDIDISHIAEHAGACSNSR